MKKKQRFRFIDEFRGLVGVMMLLGHSSYYFNSIWTQLDPLDPLFGDWSQFALRYMGYLCAPGFLMMNGAMVWYSYNRRRAGGAPDWSARWHLIQRGLFLVVVQMLWVNSSWGGFSALRPGHLGIIACIGISMCFLTLIVNTAWWVRLLAALTLFGAHPWLLERFPLLVMDYTERFFGNALDVRGLWAGVPWQTLVDAGDGGFNKYPVIPWLGLALMGSVMANGWLGAWKTRGQRVLMSLGIAGVALVLATIIRLGRGYGNLSPFTDFGHYSFFLDQKYPPSIYHNLWFFGAVVAGVAVIHLIGDALPQLTESLGMVGRVPLFFYCIHIGILGIFSKRIGIYYREGEVTASLLGCLIMLVVMLPLTVWFGGVKRKSRNYLIQMI